MKTLSIALIASIVFLASCSKDDMSTPASTDFYKDENITITSAKAEAAAPAVKFTMNVTGNVSKIQGIHLIVYPTLQTVPFAIKEGENVFTANTPGAISYGMYIYTRGTDPLIKFSSTNYFKVQ